MMKLLPSLLLLTGAFSSQAQLVKRMILYFDNNAHAVTKVHQLQLDSFIASLPNIPEAFTADVKGHTDQTGALGLNTTLSRNRAANVLAYLKKKKIASSDSCMRYYAYHKPDPANTAGNSARNRRVEISIYIRKLDMPKILAINDFKPRLYRFNEDEGGKLSYDSTSITIPANAFTHRDGSEVSGYIDLSYIEFRNPSDFILSGIPMSIQTPNGLGHFNSGGMLNIKAFQNKEELVLKTAADKSIRFYFPLENVIDQRFYQFDSSLHAWNTASQPLTNMHGNLIPPFGMAPMTGNPNGDSDPGYYYACLSGKDTAAQIAYMVAKLNYFLEHEEPIRQNYPYKFIKNNLVDFKSPLYRVNVDQKNATLEFIPVNSHNKLGAYGDYVWSFEEKNYERDIKNHFKDGCSFVKIIPSGGLRFKLNIDGQVIVVKGKPKDYVNGPKKTLFSFLQKDKQKLYDSQLKKVNRKNARSYTRYTKSLDAEERALEVVLAKKENLPGNFTFNDMYCADSLRCMDYFYKNFLYNKHPTVYGIENFNLNRDVLAEKMKQLPKPFTRKAAQRLMLQKDSTDKALIAIRKANTDNMQKTFASFGINATGIYNADQVKRIENPQEILAEYENEDGKTLKIISVSVSIKGFNGVICYNGYAGYGPYHFVYGQADQTMMVAVDAAEKAYFCTPEEFSRFVKNRVGNKATFVLKPLQNLSSKTELEKIVLK